MDKQRRFYKFLKTITYLPSALVFLLIGGFMGLAMVIALPFYALFTPNRIIIKDGEIKYKKNNG